MIPETKTITLTLFLEGLYNGGGIMNQAHDANGPRFGSGIADQITNCIMPLPTNTIVYVSNPISLGIDGHATVTIPDLYNLRIHQFISIAKIFPNVLKMIIIFRKLHPK